MKRGFSGTMACVSAVIGAGFASGREIVVFFTRYGAYSWWLILLASMVMMLLCALCMRCSLHCGGTECWCIMFQKRSRSAEVCTVLLMTVTGGAMISAAGQMIALLWPNEWAYSLGAVGTLLLAWIATFSNTKAFGRIGSGLTVFFLLVVICVMLRGSEDRSIVIRDDPSLTTMLDAAVRVVGYAAMNMTLAIGMVCRCTGRSMREVHRLSGLFGGAMALLLCISNALYMLHPSLWEAPFPIVMLLADFGRRGFIVSVLLLYLSIWTTLIAIIYALRCMMEEHVHSRCLQAILTMGLPLGVSLIGFAGIVDGWYAPAGIVCMLLVFLPLVKKPSGNKETLDNPLWIQ